MGSSQMLKVKTIPLFKAALMLPNPPRSSKLIGSPNVDSFAAQYPAEMELPTGIPATLTEAFWMITPPPPESRVVGSQ